MTVARASASPTSMQLSLENKVVVEQTGSYVQTLSKIIDGKRDVIGYAYAINGQLNSAEVYASHDLFLRMWPKMLQASAAEALGERRGDRPGSAVDAASVKTALAAADQRIERVRGAGCSLGTAMDRVRGGVTDPVAGVASSAEATA